MGRQMDGNALRRVATVESIGSSTRIEGAKLSDKQVEALLAGLEVKDFASRDEEEVAGYAETTETIFADWTLANLEAEDLHPLIGIALFIVVFLEIHPFQDGNGRISRILTTLLLLRAGYAYVPYSSLESVIEQSKDAYYLGLRQTQASIRADAPNWQPWLTFFRKPLHDQRPPKSAHSRRAH